VRCSIIEGTKIIGLVLLLYEVEGEFVLYKIYLVENDMSLRDHIKEYLEKFDYQVYIVKDYKRIDEEFDVINPDLVLLDIHLPYYDGFYYCRAIRRKSKVPIMFVSATTEDIQQIMAIELGGDDYITKPFSLQLLLSKINAFLRRVYGEYGDGGQSDEVTVKGLTLDERSFKMVYGGQVFELSKNEFKLLKMLMEHVDQVVSREDLLTILWDEDAFVDDNTLTVNVTRVKNRLKEAGLLKVIKNKRGVGYVFESSAL